MTKTNKLLTLHFNPYSIMFPKVNPKQSFPELEEQILKFWKENKTFEKSVESRPEDNPYRFYDWPPFITWTPHYGSLLSSICKDIVPRYQTMLWKRVERVWWWDCHGIPIEDKVQKKLWLESNKDIEKVGMKKFIDECYNYTTSTSAEWEWYIDHIWRWVDFKNSYKTMDQDYMESVINVFKKLYDKWLIYKGQRSSLYSWKLSTPISNFEIAMDDSYEEVSDPAITVMFPLTENWNHTKVWDYILAWTTTPWTIPAHMAIAVNQNLAYSRVLSEWKYFILATARVETTFKWREYEIVDSFMWDKLVGLKYNPPFDYYVNKVDQEKNHIIYHADFVTDTDWVGIAHEAPEFWDVDFELAKEKSIHISNALDNEWKYTSEIKDLEWTHYQEANKIIPERLKELWLLFKKESINHRVAMCPRTWTPLIYKVQESWFIDIKNLKDRLIEENEWINWAPEHLKHGQFLKSMESAPDWCISRTRYRWAPMPIWRWKNWEIKVLWSRDEIFEENKEFGQITKVILVRHWRTGYNEREKFDSEWRAKLNDKWIEQALEIRNIFSNEKIDKIYSSPLDRCIDTISPLSKEKNIDIIKEEWLTEADVWELNNKKAKFSYYRNNKDEQMWWWETYREMETRVKNTYAKILKDNAWKTIVICTHWDPAYAILSEILWFEIWINDNQKVYLDNKSDNIKELYSVKYVFSNSWKELDLHRPYIDNIFIKNENNFVAKDILWIHGFKRHPEALIDFFEKTKVNFEKEWINLDAPTFEEWPNIQYKNWENILNNLDLNKYDTWVCHSLWCKVAREYIIEHRLKLKRLVLVAASNNNWSTPETKKFSEVLKHNYKDLKNYVEEIIFIKSTNDPDSPYEWVKELSQEIWANLITAEDWHFNVTESKLIEAIVKYWVPMQRIPEVLDCWVESGSMPYAQMHYPFENKQAMEASFPADFIVEYIWQVRAWFYVMHVLWVALFDTRAFTNVITTWIVMWSDGRKMSKSYKNYPDPKKTIETYWADAIRFYMANSPLLSGWNMNFMEQWVQEVIKKVILPLWNTYSFFTTYANIDKFETKKWWIYLVRHAESETNAKSKTASISWAWDNPKLTENWINQSIEAWKKLNLEWIKFDKIYSSPLDRCRQTAELIAKGIWYDSSLIILENLLKEQDYSEFEWMLHSEIAEKHWIDPNDTASIRKIYKNSKVENYRDFNSRVKKFIDKITNKNKDENILIVSHAWTTRPFMKEFLDLDLDYAHLEMKTPKNALVIKLPNSKLNNSLDKWIISELHKLIWEVKSWLDNYKINESTRVIVRFMDNLTNWYIRRSRKRFWKSENDSDKLQAYETLYTVLVEFCKLIAPFMPFISEHIYKNLTWQESVHLWAFPDKIESFILTDLNKDMELTQKIISLWLAWRANNKIRVRQPLRSITIWEKLKDYYIDIIKEELNVKEVIILDDPSKIAKKICKPNGRLIWPKFWKDVKFIISEAKSGNFEELKNGKILICHPELDSGSIEKIKSELEKDSASSIKWKYFVLEWDEFEIAFEASKTNYSIEAWFWMVIAMDPILDNNLIQEWIARDIVRFIQESRKEANYEVDDRISISIISSEWDESKNLIQEILKNFWKYIETETLSTIKESIENSDLVKEVEIEGNEIEISLKK